jgi:outer membrane lipoprotein-sorting protein
MPNPRIRRIAPAVLLAAALSAGIVLAAGPAIECVQAAQAKPSGLPPAVLAQMDAASARFSSAQADVRQELFTKVVHDTETQTGQVYFLRKGGSTQMGMTLLPPGAAPGAAPAQVLEFSGAKGRMFNPGTNQVDESSATGKNQQLAETFLTLGFGGSGTDLAKAWTITDLGSEQLSDGKQTVKTEKLDLVSKDPGIRNNFSHVTIWIDPARDVSLKQVSYQASGDTRTMYYTNIRLNQPVDLAPFAIKCKGKCTVVTH